MSVLPTRALNIALLADNATEATFFGGNSEATLREGEKSTNNGDFASPLAAIALLVMILGAFVQTTPNPEEVQAGIDTYTTWIAEKAPATR